MLAIHNRRYSQSEKGKLARKKRESTQKGKENIRMWNITTTHGLSKEQYFSLIESQDNKCAICKDILELDHKTHVDHCHSTGKIRGILCHGCNTGLGLFKDNIDSLKNAIKYLKNSE